MEATLGEYTSERLILTSFQINKETGFTEDFKTSCMQGLVSYFSEEDSVFAEMHLWGETLQGICDKFSSYKAYIESMVDKLQKQLSFQEKWIDNDVITQTLLDILSPYNEHEFETDFNNIKDQILFYNSDREEILALLNDFRIKYFPQPQDRKNSHCLEFQIEDFKKEVLKKIKQIS